MGTSHEKVHILHEAEHLQSRPVARFSGLGGNKVFGRGQGFCFYYMFKKIFLSTTKFGGQYPLVARGRGRGTKKVENHWSIGLISRIRTVPVFFKENVSYPVWTCRGQGRIQRAIGAIDPLKLTKVTFFTMILYNSENSIRDI